jgi:adenosylhomocysteine nucleosidase
MVLLLGSCSSSVLQTSNEPVLAILGAFDKEITLLQDKLSNRREQEIEGIEFVSGELNGQKVVIAWTGIGKVNAAMTTTLTIEHFKPDKVIFTGIAGGVNPKLEPGDIVIAEKTAQHDSGILWPEGFMHQGVKNPFDGTDNPVFFYADEQLLKFAQLAAKHVQLKKIQTKTEEKSPQIVTGVVVTGDTFVASNDKCIELRDKLNADAVEMEGAAVAQICYQRRIGYLVIRCISDKADESAVKDKQMFYLMAAENSAELVAETVGLLTAEPSTEENISNRQ